MDGNGQLFGIAQSLGYIQSIGSIKHVFVWFKGLSEFTTYETKSGRQGELLIVRHRRHQSKLSCGGNDYRAAGNALVLG